MGDVSLSKEYEDLINEVNSLRESLLELSSYRDELKFTICKNILMEYNLQIGYLEYDLYKLYFEFMRLRRKKDYIQMYINRGEEIDFNHIESELSKLFKEYEDNLRRKMDEINDAIDRKNLKSLTAEESVELKLLYREIMKKLHPDLNPNQSEDHKKLFLTAVEAYKNGELTNIRIIHAILSGLEKNKEDLKPRTLSEERERLKILIQNLTDEITNIKSKRPYTLKIYLDDDEKKREKLNEINAQIVAYKDAIRTVEEAIKKLAEEKDE